jgi:8-oxo-dGTP pyrophosphatase MutT (NUDIX family)
MSVEIAARREVIEETGIKSLRHVGSALLRIDAHGIPERGREPPHVHIDLGIGFRALSPEIGPLNEVLDAKWVRFGELARYDVDDALEAGANAVRRAAG